jgi:hypothetical protein
VQHKEEKDYELSVYQASHTFLTTLTCFSKLCKKADGKAQLKVSKSIEPPEDMEVNWCLSAYCFLDINLPPQRVRR